MARIEKLKPFHLEYLKKAGALGELSEYLTETKIQGAVDARWSWAFIGKLGVIGCWGIAEWWEGRGEAWALFLPGSGPEFLSIHRHVLGILETVPLRRVEAAIDPKSKASVKWALMLGFQCEAERMRNYSIEGEDMMLFARVKN